MSACGIDTLVDETASAIARVYHNVHAWDAALEWVGQIKNVDLRDRKSVDLLRHRAYERMEAGNLEGAMADCDGILQIRPDDAYAFRIKGDLLNLGELPKENSAVTESPEPERTARDDDRGPGPHEAPPGP